MTDALQIARDLIRSPSVTPADAGALSRTSPHLTLHVPPRDLRPPGAADVNFYARSVNDGHILPLPATPTWCRRATKAPARGVRASPRGEVQLLAAARSTHEGSIACSVAVWTSRRRKPRSDGKGSISFLITGDEEDVSVDGTIKLLKWAADAARNSTIACSASPRMSGQGRSRGSQSGTRCVDGVWGGGGAASACAPAVPPIRCLISRGSSWQSPTSRSISIQVTPASNLEFASVNVRDTANNVIPGQARAKFNIRYNDNQQQSEPARLARRG